MWGGRHHLGHVSVASFGGGAGDDDDEPDEKRRIGATLPTPESRSVRSRRSEESQGDEAAEETPSHRRFPRQGAEHVAAAAPFVRRYGNPGAKDGRVRPSHRPPLRALMSSIAAHQSFINNEFLNDCYSFIVRRNREENPPTKGEVLDMLKRKLQFRFFADTRADSNVLYNVKGAFFTAQKVDDRLTEIGIEQVQEDQQHTLVDSRKYPANWSSSERREFDEFSSELLGLKRYTPLRMSFPDSTLVPFQLKIGMRVKGRVGGVQHVIDATSTDATISSRIHNVLGGNSFTIAHAGMEVTRPGVEGGTTIESVDIDSSEITLAHAVDETREQMEFVLHGNREDAFDVLVELFKRLDIRAQHSAQAMHLILLIYALNEDVSTDTIIRDNVFRYDGAQRFVRAIEDLVINTQSKKLASKYLLYNHLSNLMSSVVETTPEQDERALYALRRDTELDEFGFEISDTQSINRRILQSSTYPFIVANVRREAVPTRSTTSFEATISDAGVFMLTSGIRPSSGITFGGTIGGNQRTFTVNSYLTSKTFTVTPSYTDGVQLTPIPFKVFHSLATVVRGVSPLPDDVVSLYYNDWNALKKSWVAKESVIVGENVSNRLTLSECSLTGDVVFSYRDSEHRDRSLLYKLFLVFSKAFNHYLRERGGSAKDQDAVKFAISFVEAYLQYVFAISGRHGV